MFCFLFLLCLEYKLWKAAWPLLCTDSSWNPSEHNFQPVENIHCHPNTQETSTHSAQPLPHRCPDISCNEMSWKNPAKHYRTVTTNTDTLQFVYNARSYSKYGGIPAAPSPSALGFTWQLYQASLCWFQFRIQHHPETQNLNITPIWSTSSKTPSAGQQKKWEWTQPHHLYPKLELCRDACWALTHISFILMAYQLPSHTFNMRTT